MASVVASAAKAMFKAMQCYRSAERDRVKTALSPLRGLFIFYSAPTAYAVGCNLAPLRG